MLPVISTSTTLFNVPTTKDSLNPNNTSVTNITIFESPSLAPGTVIGRGIADSNTDSARPIDTNKDKNIIFFNLIIVIYHP